MKKILISVMILMLVIGLLGAGTFAYFTDTETSATNSFTSGTLILNGPGITSFDFDVDNMAPGDVTDEQVVIIHNDGTLPLFWFGDWIISGGGILNEAIYIDYAKMEFLGGSWAEPTDNFITDGLGSGPYPGWYDILAGLNTFDVVGLDVWDDNNGMGTTPYEQVGALKPGFSYKLTVKFGFAPGAGNSYQGLGPMDVTLTIDAIQANQTQLTNLGQGAMWSWLNTQLANQTP